MINNFVRTYFFMIYFIQFIKACDALVFLILKEHNNSLYNKPIVYFDVFNIVIVCMSIS